MAADTLDAQIARFSTEQLNDAANDSGDAQTPYRLFRFNAMNFSTQLSSGIFRASLAMAVQKQRFRVR
jgi:hypothetical protein